MDKSLQFKEYREKYKEFYYNNYTIKENKESILLEFEFEISNLVKFNPKIKILKKQLKLKNIEEAYAKNMVFNIGLIELISYWKSTCAPKIIIKCGMLTEEQINWWKKLYFYGLGELFYTNNIQTNIDDFVTIECKNEIKYNLNIPNEQIQEDFEGYIVPIGGRKRFYSNIRNIKNK